MGELLKDLWDFMKERKKYWLAPIIIVMLLLGALIFFSQGFCPKAQLARHLAEVHRGMHVDVHETVNAAVRAKIEAFIRLSKRGGQK